MNKFIVAKCLLFVSATAGLWVSAPSQAETVGYEGASLSFGLGGGGSTVGGPSGSTFAVLRAQSEGNTVGQYSSAIGSIDGEATYNVFGVSPEGLSTGVKLRGEARIGFTPPSPHGSRTDACNIYTAAAARAVGQANLHRAGQDYVDGFVGGEAGLICILDGDKALLISPSVGVGFTGVTSATNFKEVMSTADNLIRLGGITRLVVHRKFTASLVTMGAPQVSPKAAPEGRKLKDHTLFSGELNVEGRHESWVFGGYAKAIHLQTDPTLKPAQNTGLLTAEAGVRVGAAF